MVSVKTESFLINIDCAAVYSGHLILDGQEYRFSASKKPGEPAETIAILDNKNYVGGIVYLKPDAIIPVFLSNNSPLTKTVMEQQAEIRDAVPHDYNRYNVVDEAIEDRDLITFPELKGYRMPDGTMNVQGAVALGDEGAQLLFFARYNPDFVAENCLYTQPFQKVEEVNFSTERGIESAKEIFGDAGNFANRLTLEIQKAAAAKALDVYRDIEIQNQLGGIQVPVLKSVERGEER